MNFLHVSKYCCTFEGEYRKSRTLKQYNSMSIKRFIPPLSVRGTGSGSLRLLFVLASCSKDETFNTGERVILPEGCKKIDVDFSGSLAS